MRAAQAAGAAGWEKLTELFCKPVEGMNVTPNAENARVYEDMQTRYAAFAEGAAG
jgi:sugar (pentulose or hexulose) kinase